MYGTTLIILHNLYIIMYAALCTCTPFLTLCFTAVYGSVNRMLCNTARAAIHFVGKGCNIKYCVCEKCTALSVIQFSQCDFSIHTS